MFLFNRGDKYERPIGVLFDAKEGRWVAGQIKLKRGDLLDSNVISIADDKFFHIAHGDSLRGVSEAGKISVLDCVRGGVLDTTSWEDFAIHHGDVSFRYALFGRRHIAINEKCIRGIQFTLEGAESSVFMHDKFDRFGLLRNPDQEILDTIKRKMPEYKRGNFVKDNAMVSYFTGDWNVLPRFETVLGTVHVGRSMQIDFSGLSMESTPRITIDFDDNPTTLESAWGKMREVHQFFAWMMGYAPGWKDVLVSTSRLDENGLWSDVAGCLEVFGPNEWKEVPEVARQCGTLIDASRHPDHFMEVMANWLKRNGNARRKSANARFFGCIRGISDRFIEDGIVSAANTFDLLPDEDKPETEPLPENVLDVLTDADRKIKCCMPLGMQRDDVLSALGLIRHSRRLRHIVEHRAEFVLKHYGVDVLQNLKDLIRLAVKCRNYYTHGPRDKDTDNVKYTDVEVVFFLTETLEFIYSASELLLCGWDLSKSANDEWHPFGEYIKSYDAKRSRVLGPK
ncbi:MAG: hypothetical protein OXI88_00555 [Gammaproteobacteria bacterium]|nr:hypothetical protein [Gammaproteobacteria bacterium]MDE0284670.1 hypothetical protein [Gammaproteobacteria bacterium]MDE0510271.1 hypothetical protein [Gammaproteobacteria bacterium]